MAGDQAAERASQALAFYTLSASFCDAASGFDLRPRDHTQPDTRAGPLSGTLASATLFFSLYVKDLSVLMVGVYDPATSTKQTKRPPEGGLFVFPLNANPALIV